MEKRNLIVGFAALIASALLVPNAKANLMLTLSETGFAPLIITDSVSTGSVSFFGSYGDFQTNFVAGISDKLTSPVPSQAILQIQSIDVKNLSTAGVTKTLSLTLTDDGYTFPGTTGGPVALGSSMGGTLTGSNAGDSITFQSFVVNPPISTAPQTYVAPATDASPTSFSSTATPVVFVRPASYDLTNVTTISLTGAFEQANLSGTTSVSTAVPEPSNALVGAAVGLLALRRNRRRA